MRQIVGMRHFWMVFLSLALWYGVVMGLATWLPSFFRDLCSTGQVIAGLALVLLSLSFAPGGWPVAAALVVLAGVIGSWYVVSMPLVKETVPHELAGTAIGILNTAPFIGAFLYPWLMGLSLEYLGRDLGGYRMAFGLCIAGLALALLLASQARETLHV